ncbi:peptide deformylase [Heliorestis acidaminivorans]|uniref:Peptide deformylase n=1 Tax=Heliorestis acidaminivorans TaxID=553427 RepID=A0A6I0F4J8_9FIRM|nr:peptide deformylase [Heliorestis acidaminivorans]KAB2954473.1 peptide deformylase [Heliorestis acidaminivorans]
MAIYEILTVGHPALREKAREVTKFNENLGRLLDNMVETMVSAQGVGLAAPQIGIAKRVVVIDVGQGPVELVNPVLMEYKGTLQELEGCLSVPEFTEEVERHAWVKVKAQDRYGKEFFIEGTELLSRALQHEIDHLDGILFIDRTQRGPLQER